MRLLTIFFVLLLASIALASESTPVETLAYASVNDPVRQCMQSCLDSYERPGPELKSCLARCQKLRPHR